MSPEAISPYSDRPIRPLPKRRLRERLSPDVVELIKYPLAPRAKPPMFYHSYSLRGETGSDGSGESLSSSERKRFDELEKNYISRRNDKDLAGEIEEAAYSDWIFSRRSVDTTSNSYSFFQKPDTKNYNSQPPGSTASSVDGYDSFENTNNKKKRKIPIPGESNLNGIRISGEMIGCNSADDLDDLVNQNSSSLQGMCGPGRGRYGRNRHGRSPINALSDISGNWSSIRSARQRQAQWSSSPETSGIISRSIANANAERNLFASTRLQGDTSLQEFVSKKSSPVSTQFTFSCDTQVPGWPGLSTSHAIHQNSLPSRMSTHATQTSPKIASKRGIANSKEIPIVQPNTSNGLKHNQDQATPKKTRRRTGKDYLIAAKQRRHQQGYRNYHSPISSEDIWVCEFCEYERIFGTPPEALIRQYEIKDRRARKQEAERRRLLEKAKMKGRKGKKGNKSTNKSTLNHDRPSHIQNQNTHSSSADKAYLQNQTYTNHGEECIKDEHDHTSEIMQDQHQKLFAPPPNLSDIDSISSELGIYNDSRVDVSNENYVTT